LVIRDGDRDMEKKHQATRLSEFFSTRFFSFNKTTENGLHFLSGSTIRELVRNRQMECRAIEDSALTSNRIFVITHPVNNYEKV